MWLHNTTNRQNGKPLTHGTSISSSEVHHRDGLDGGPCLDDSQCDLPLSLHYCVGSSGKSHHHDCGQMEKRDRRGGKENSCLSYPRIYNHRVASSGESHHHDCGQMEKRDQEEENRCPPPPPYLQPPRLRHYIELTIIINNQDRSSPSLLH